jgi:hypothetical protein
MAKSYYLSVEVGVNVNIDPHVENSTSIRKFLKKEQNIELLVILSLFLEYHHENYKIISEKYLGTVKKWLC